MKKNGFTLIEMISVVIIVALIAIVAVPNVTNQIANNKNKISDTTKRLIFDAAELYVSDRETEYPKLSGNIYCLSLDKLASAGYITSPVKDFQTGNIIPLTKNVRIQVVMPIANGSLEYEAIDFVDNC